MLSQHTDICTKQNADQETSIGPVYVIQKVCVQPCGLLKFPSPSSACKNPGAAQQSSCTDRPSSTMYRIDQWKYQFCNCKPTPNKKYSQLHQHLQWSCFARTAHPRFCRHSDIIIDVHSSPYQKEQCETETGNPNQTDQ